MLTTNSMSTTTPPRETPHPRENSGRDAVETAIDVVKQNKSGTWDGIAARNADRIAPWPENDTPRPRPAPHRLRQTRRAPRTTPKPE